MGAAIQGEFDRVGIPPTPRGIPQIEVTFDIDANSIEVTFDIDANSIEFTFDIDSRNTADTTTYSVEKSMNEYKDKIPAEVASEIEAAVADSKKASGGDNVEVSHVRHLTSLITTTYRFAIYCSQVGHYCF
ncbi:hypothetical protein POM88_006748 [Heracleum sosnowskyi]|uniref:Heat shock protein 70 n=1 Tax=Heracleum sosnowskyi TaxID=360622 RepID=A0AAD8N098_9APIA|nr:hypothetical protein POM88_006748 [Heracleum sosnowskyi]